MAQTKNGAAKIAAAYYGFSLEEYYKKLESESYCNKCKQWKPKYNFSIDRSRSNGLNKSCQSCRCVKVRKKPVGMTGKRHTKESRKKMSDVIKSNWKLNPRTGWHHSEETRLKIGISNKGKSRPGISGSKHYNWKGGITPEEKRIRKSQEYKDWRKSVFERDKYTCQKCYDSRGGNLQAHHLKSFADYPEFRFAIDNGLTLCEDCHVNIHSK